jgi:hypothetical protein
LPTGTLRSQTLTFTEVRVKSPVAGCIGERHGLWISTFVR